MAKQKTISLTYPHFTRDREYVNPQISGWDGQEWEVGKVTDSIEFNPGQRLKAAEVQKLCADDGWKVTITRVS